MTKKLKDISEISTGVTFRMRLEHATDGNVSIIQMKDLGDDHTVKLNELVKFKIESPKQRQYVKKFDIKAVQKEIETLESELGDVRQKMAELLNEVGV